MANYNTYPAVSIVISSILVHETFTVSVEKDLTLTWDQKLQLDKFKKEVMEYIPHDYMKEDIYLIRWLRARNFNLKAAKTMLLDNLEWRRKNRIDESHDEDWSDFEKRYRYYRHGRDREGQPVAYLDLGTWDVRRAVISGEQTRLLRYLDRIMDQLCMDVRDLQAKGENVTRVDLIDDLKGFSLTEHGCLQCLSIYVQFVLSYENHFPGFADKLLLINTPAAFEIVLNAIKPFLSPMTKDSLEVIGTNRRQWKAALNKYIAPEELPPDLGGSDLRYYENEFE